MDGPSSYLPPYGHAYFLPLYFISFIAVQTSTFAEAAVAVESVRIAVISLWAPASAWRSHLNKNKSSGAYICDQTVLWDDTSTQKICFEYFDDRVIKYVL